LRNYEMTEDTHRVQIDNDKKTPQLTIL